MLNQFNFLHPKISYRTALIKLHSKSCSSGTALVCFIVRLNKVLKLKNHLGNVFRQIETLLAERGANPNTLLPEYGIAPFHMVVANESTRFAVHATDICLQHGADPNVRYRVGLLNNFQVLRYDGLVIRTISPTKNKFST